MPAQLQGRAAGGLCRDAAPHRVTVGDGPRAGNCPAGGPSPEIVLIRRTLPASPDAEFDGWIDGPSGDSHDP
jgi:hypothetical protein